MKASVIKGRWYQWALAARYIPLVFFAAIFIFPVIFMLVSSLKPDLQLLSDTSSLRAFLPIGDISFNNYREAFDRVPMARFIFNSVLVTTITLALALIINSMAAFSLALLKWRGQGFVLSVIIATFIIPFETVAVPLLLIVNKLPSIDSGGISTGWLNSYHVQIIPFITDAFNIFLFYQYFKDLPAEIIEAAEIDGASWFQIYRRVVVPLSGPVFATAAILKFLAMWNQYL